MLYVPVIHEGYLNLFGEQSASGVEALYIPDERLIRQLTFLEPEIRAVNPDVIAQIVRSLGYFKTVEVMSAGSMPELDPDITIITVREGFSERLVESFYTGYPVEYQTIFLRWDEASVAKSKPAGYDRISSDEIDQTMMARAEQEGERSGDWWRQVGAVAVADGQILLTAFNHHVPSQLLPYAEGDPRDFVTAGTSPELATAIHAEQAVIAEAARQGLSLEGASLYLPVFPCPVCAKLIAYSGFKRVYFRTGHASVDGQTILNRRGVEIILVP